MKSSGVKSFVWKSVGTAGAISRFGESSEVPISTGEVVSLLLVGVEKNKSW